MMWVVVCLILFSFYQYWFVFVFVFNAVYVFPFLCLFSEISEKISLNVVSFLFVNGPLILPSRCLRMAMKDRSGICSKTPT